MRGSWVAGGVRARGLLERRLGAAARAEVAARGSLEDALRSLAATGYGADLRTVHTLEQAERAVGAAALWNLRVLAGWLPARGTELVRVMAGWFELANVDATIAALVAGTPVPTAYVLGGLGTARPGVAAARTLGDVRAALAASAWGDPGSDEPATLRRAMVASWGRRIAGSVPEALPWVGGAGALAAARELYLGGPPADRLPEIPGVPADSLAAGSPDELRRRLPGEAAWALDGVRDTDGLWRAELRWWRRVESDATVMATGTIAERPAIVGGVALILVDARETARALGVAARGGVDAEARVGPDVPA